MAARAETQIPDLAARPVRELARHDRPQADRDPLPRDGVRVLRPRRAHGHGDAAPARTGERRRRRPGAVQRAHDDPRDGDGLPRRRADPRRPRELPRPAHARRARRRLPAPERALLLALRARRRRAHALVLRRRAARTRRAGRATRRSARSSPETARTSGSCRSTSSRRPRSPARSTSSSRSTTCARRG